MFAAQGGLSRSNGRGLATSSALAQQPRDVCAQTAWQRRLPGSERLAHSDRESGHQRTGTGTVRVGAVLAISRPLRYLRSRDCRFESCRAYHLRVEPRRQSARHASGMAPCVASRRTASPASPAGPTTCASSRAGSRPATHRGWRPASLRAARLHQRVLQGLLHRPPSRPREGSFGPFCARSVAPSPVRPSAPGAGATMQMGHGQPDASDGECANRLGVCATGCP